MSLRGSDTKNFEIRASGSLKVKREIWAPSGLRSKKGNLSLKREI